ncbi:hypothetical protein 12VC501_gene0030 [Vibrio phage 12VC501]|nr:hypothetical protein 12VC501_gene0030 [Vibrio phage 12VC501]
MLFDSVRKAKQLELPINYNTSHWSVRKQAREQYVTLQDGKCWFCNNLLKEEPTKEILSKPINIKLFPKNMFQYPIHLHHDHNTGMTIGAVHARCNAVLWQYYGQ